MFFRSVLVYLVFFALLGCSSFSQITKTWRPQEKQYNLRKLWVRSTIDGDHLSFRKINRATPVLLNNMLIQPNSMDGLVAYERDSGQRLWKIKIENGIEASLTRVQNRLFFGASDGFFYSVNALTGEVVWRFQTGAENISEPLVEEGKVYFLSGNNTLFALDAVDGKQLWIYSRPDTSSFSIRGGSKPVLNQGHLYVGFSDGFFMALNSQNGNVVWEVRLNKGKKFRDIDATALVDKENIYIAGYDDQLYALSQARGEIIWKLDQGGFTGVTLYGEKLLYSTTEGQVLALEKTTGQISWKYNLKTGLATQPKVHKGFVIFGESQGGLQFLDLQTGQLKLSFFPGRGIMAAPYIEEKSDRIYFISTESNLYALELELNYQNRWVSSWDH